MKVTSPIPVRPPLTVRGSCSPCKIEVILLFRGVFAVAALLGAPLCEVPTPWETGEQRCFVCSVNEGSVGREVVSFRIEWVSLSPRGNGSSWLGLYGASGDGWVSLQVILELGDPVCFSTLRKLRLPVGFWSWLVIFMISFFKVLDLDLIFCWLSSWA